MACYYNSWPLIGQKSAHVNHEVLNTVTLIGSLLVSQGQKGASNIRPLQTIARGHGGSEPLPSQRVVVVKR